MQIPGTGLNLIYHSSKSSGYLSTIQLQLTPDTIPLTLKLIHLSIAIEGILFEKKFEADPNIRYTYAWNRLNVYKYAFCYCTEFILLGLPNRRKNFILVSLVICADKECTV